MQAYCMLLYAHSWKNGRSDACRHVLYAQQMVPCSCCRPRGCAWLQDVHALIACMPSLPVCAAHADMSKTELGCCHRSSDELACVYYRSRAAQAHVLWRAYIVASSILWYLQVMSKLLRVAAQAYASRERLAASKEAAADLGRGQGSIRSSFNAVLAIDRI